MKASQSSGVLSQIITYFRILLTRIKEKKEIEAESSIDETFIPFNLDSIILDIKTLYLFAKIYLDYFIKYITVYFLKPNLDLRHKSFNEHVKSLNKIRSKDSWFNEYKALVFKYERKIKFRVKYVRDKMIIHRELKINEGWGFDDQNHKVYIYFEKSLDPINIDVNLKNDIITLGKKYNINIVHDKKAISDFVYLDLILFNLENTPSHLEKKNVEDIVKYRDKLGIIVNEENIFQLIIDFSKDITLHLKKKYPKISTRFVSRY